MVICCAAVNCSNRQGKGEKRAVSFHRYAARLRVRHAPALAGPAGKLRPRGGPSLGDRESGAGWPSVTVGGGRVVELCDLGSDRRLCGPARPCLGQSGRRPPPPPPPTGVALIWAGPANFRSILQGRVLSLPLLFGFEQFSTLASAGQARLEVCGRSAARRTQLYFLHP